MTIQITTKMFQHAFFTYFVLICYSIKLVMSQGTVSCVVTPYKGGCGVLAKPPNFAQSFVTADPEVAPWQAVVTVPTTPTRTCGAVIVDNRHVITSASCLPTIGSNDVTVTKVSVGDSDLNPATVECQTKIHSIDKIYTYPGWNPAKPTEDDVAVLKVQGEIAFNQYVRPACLPLSTDGPYFDYSTFAETTFYTAWKDLNSKLLFMKTPLSKTCPSDLSDANSGRYERYNLLCSGASGTSCARTTGSGVVADVKGIWRVLGINGGSVGPNCATGLAFWRLAFYRDWLLSVGIVQTEGAIDTSCSTPTYTGSCGVTKIQWIPKSLPLLSPRIINGRAVQAGQLPWQVNLDVDGFQCGGGIINKNFILTAAHCFINKQKVVAPKEKIRVTIGDIDSSKRECHERQVTVAELILHPNYNDDLIVNDIALLRLTADITFDDYIRPICLPPKEHGNNFDYSTMNGKLVAAGWGRSKTNDESTSDVLLATDIQVMKDCPSEDATNPNRIVKAEMICSPTKTDKDTCQGDSGGILAANMDSKWTAIGIVSYGNKECTGEAAYTRVSNYLDWIAEKTSDTVNPVLPGNLVPIHVESGILSEVGLYDLKAIFCTVSAEGGVGPTGFNCKDADGTKVPKGNVVCGDKIVISKRDYSDALVDRKWDTAVRTGDTLILESIKTLLNGKGLKGDDIVKCMGKSYGRESGCKLLVPNPKTYLCNDKYITSESLYNVILKSAPTTS